MGIYVEGPPANAQHPELGFLDRETGVYEKHLVLAGNPLGAGDERGEGTRHRTRSRDAAFRADVQVDKGLDKTAGSRLQGRIALRGGILGAYSRIQGLLLGENAVLIYRQTGRTLVHTYERYARLLFQITGDEQDLADSGVGESGHTGGLTGLLHKGITE